MRMSLWKFAAPLFSSAMPGTTTRVEETFDGSTGKTSSDRW